MTIFSLRRLTAFALAVGVLAATASAQEAERTDPYGDALPAGARARLGTVRWRQADYVQALTFMAEGKFLILSEYGVFRVKDMATGKDVRVFGSSQRLGNASYVSASIVSADGRFVAAMAGLDKTLRVWETASGKELWKLALDAKNSNIQPLAFAADGSMLVTRGAALQFWETATGKELGQITPPVRVSTVAFAPNGAILATSALDAASYLWEAPGGKLLRKLGEANARVYSNFRPVFSGDGKLLTTMTISREAPAKMLGTVKVWEVETGKEVRTLKGPEEAVNGGVLSPNGEIMAWTSASGVIHLQDIVTGKPLHQLGEALAPRGTVVPLFSPDGSKLFVGQGQVHRLYDVQTGKQLWQLDGLTYPRGAAFAPDGTTLALTNSPGITAVIHVIDVATGKELSGGGGHRGSVMGLAVSADGKTVTTRSTDNAVRQWDPATGKERGLLTFPAATLTGFSALSTDGRLVAVHTTGAAPKIEVWDVAAARVVQTLDMGPGRTTGMLFAPDGKTLAVRGGDAIVRLYDVASGKEQGQMDESNLTRNPVNQGVQYGPLAAPGMVFSPDGSTLATAWYGLNRMNNQRHSLINLWQVSSGKKIGRVETRQGSHVSALVCSPDGRTVATFSYATGNPRVADDLMISLWETATGRERCRFKSGSLSASPVALAFSPDGLALAVGGSDRVIRLWNVRTGKELGQLSGHQGAIASLVFAADGRSLLSGSADTTALVWDLEPLLARQPLPASALAEKRLESLWTDLAGTDGGKAFQAVHTLSAVPMPTLDWLRARLKPAAGIEEKRLTALIASLSDDKFAVREKATAELEKLGELAEPALRKVMDKQPNLDLARRIQRILDRLEPDRELSADMAQAVRAVEVLELVGTADARQLLQTLADGAPGARLTREAQAALKRLPVR